MAADDSSTLIILLETHHKLWESPQFCESDTGTALSTPQKYIEQVLTFLRAFLLVSEANKAAVFAVHHKSCPLLYESSNLRQRHGGTAPADALPGPELKARLAELASRQDDNEEGPVLAGGLSRVLCYLHCLKVRSGAGSRELQRKPRILCLQASLDISAQYISFMNAIFSAQRGDVVIDACMVGAGHSPLLQQACHLTDGIYIKPKRPAALLEYLLAIYAGDTHSRSFLTLPKSEGVDFRASCFCHKKAIDLGYVCSVCLSIFCESLQECSTCGTAFPASGAGEKRKQR